MQLQLFNIDSQTTLVEVEEWKQCFEFPVIEVSTLGRVRNRRTGRIIQGTLKENGYIHIAFLFEGKTRTKLAHRLIAKTFLQGSPDQCYVNHKNKNRSDNRLSNLEWVTPSQNAKHSKRKS